jgi:hypothetical protein
VLQRLSYAKAKYTVYILFPYICVTMVENFDWLSTLINITASLGIAIMSMPLVALWLMRHWGVFCAFLRECRRRLLPGANPRRTPDPEQRPGDHRIELDTLDADAVPNFSRPLPRRSTRIRTQTRFYGH